MSTPELREPVNPPASPARPLAMLVALITEDLKQGREAAERAGMPFYRAAGEKMLEAKGQIPHGEFQAWIKQNFGISKVQASRYMNLARAASSKKLSALNFSSLRDFVRQTSNPSKPHIARIRPPGWQDAMKEKIERARQRAERFQQARFADRQECEAEQKLALQLIDIGYKVLAKEFHPDKGGSRDAMARLNRVRDRLKQHA